MIPEYAIKEWGQTVPWSSPEQIEQDLVICRALVEIFNDKFLSSHLAFRGGTALHKLYLQPQPRYSEDIDLVQIKAEPIKETIVRLSEVLSWLGKPVVKQKANNNTLVFRFDSEILPVLPIRLKVETNCREHFDILGLESVDFKVNNQWFTGQCSITTYKLDERSELENIYYWLPDTQRLLKHIDYCRQTGFNNDQTKALLTQKPIQFTGELYSIEFNRRYKTTDATLQLEKYRNETGNFKLTINGTNLSTWFKDKYNEWLKAIGVNQKQNQGQGRGM